LEKLYRQDGIRWYRATWEAKQNIYMYTENGITVSRGRSWFD